MRTLTAQPGSGRLHAVGPVMPVVVSGPAGSVTTMALVDTGASTTAIDEDILTRVGAQKVGVSIIAGATGQAPLAVYNAAISTPDGQLLLDGTARALGTQLPDHSQVLIGRDVLSQYQFAYDGAGRWSIGAGIHGHHCGHYPSVWSQAGAIVLGHLGTLAALLAIGTVAQSFRR